jgi:small subunit ribosomal protein S17
MNSISTPNSATATPAPAAKGSQRVLVGRVVSNKMDKTVTVLVERRVRHAVYGKYMVRSTRFHAHDETNQINEGDLVEIAETRPRSRTKTWIVTRVVTAARA